MAVAFDATANATGTAVTSISWSHTVTGAQTGGIVGVSSDGSISTVTWNAVAMTLEQFASDPGAIAQGSHWSLIAPTTGTVTATVTAASNIKGGSVSVTGAHQTTLVSNKITNSGSTASISTAVTSAVGELVVDNVETDSGGGTPTVTGGGTLRWSAALGSGSTEPGAATVTRTWTLTATGWSHCLVSIKAAASSTSSVGLERRLLQPGKSPSNLGRFFQSARGYTTAPAQLGTQVTEAPYPRGKLNLARYQDWQAGPLSADSSGPIPSQFTVLPIGRRRPFYQDWQQAPLAASVVAVVTNPVGVTEVPTRVKRGLLLDWVQAPLPSDSTGPFTKHTDLPVSKKKPLLLDWQQAPLSLDSVGPFTKTFEIPTRAKRPLLLDWEQSPLAADNNRETIGSVSEVPIRGRKAFSQDWLQAPLSADVAITARQAGVVYELPTRAKRQLLLDWVQPPVGADQPAIAPQSFDLPIRSRKLPLFGTMQQPLGADSIGPFTQAFDLPVRSRVPLHQRWEQLPLSVDSTGPFSQAFELPVRGRAPLLRTWEQQPLSSDSTGPFSQVDLLPPIGKVVKREYNGWQIAPLSPDGIIADTALKGIFWFDNPQRGRSQAHLYSGATSGPQGSSAVSTTQQFLPLLGVGS